MNIFDDLSWLYSDFTTLTITVMSTLGIYIAIVVITRLNGLRTFAKMGSFDFAITIAIGSLIGTTMLSKNQSLANGFIGLIMLIALQALVAFARKRSDSFEKLLTNTPVVLMKGSHILHDRLKDQKVTESDLYAKLREANVTNLDQVLAVVLETTGDMSVLHSGKTSDVLSEELLKYVEQ